MATDELSPEEKADARLVFSGKAVDEGRLPCVHCGGIHDRVATLPLYRQPCARVKHAVWHADGVTLLEVEYWPPTWNEGLDIVWPIDVYEETDEPVEDSA
jgi:hypothetical protein